MQLIAEPTGSNFYAISQQNVQDGTIQFYFFNSMLDSKNAYDKLSETFANNRIKGFNLYQPTLQHEIYYTTVIDMNHENYDVPFDDYDDYGFTYDFNEQRNWNEFIKMTNLYLNLPNSVREEHDTNLRTNDQPHDMIIYNQQNKPIWHLIAGKASIY